MSQWAAAPPTPLARGRHRYSTSRGDLLYSQVEAVHLAVQEAHADQAIDDHFAFCLLLQ